jgi:hypothetical protein
LGEDKFLLYNNVNTETIDSNTNCEGTLSKTFKNCADVLLHTNDDIWNSYAKKYTGLKLFKKQECYAIILYNEELDCLLGKRKEHKKCV